MADFNFKQIIRENLYNQQYPHQDRVRIILNEGQTLLLEKEIHEGIMDFLKGYTKEQPGWRKAMENEIDSFLAKSALDDGAKQQLKNYYMKNFEKLPDKISQEQERDVEDSLKAGAQGDTAEVKDEMEQALSATGDDKAQEIVSPKHKLTAEVTLKALAQARNLEDFKDIYTDSSKVFKVGIKWPEIEEAINKVIAGVYKPENLINAISRFGVKDENLIGAARNNFVKLVSNLGDPDETPTEEVPKASEAQGITSWSQYKSILNKHIQGGDLGKMQTKILRQGVWAVLRRAGLKIKRDDQGVDEVLAMMKQASTLRAGDISEGITNGDFLKKIFVESVRAFIKNENKK
jgi:hypothetical protein